MSHYVKRDGKSVYPSHGHGIRGWQHVKGARFHLFFQDGTTGCRTTTKLQPDATHGLNPVLDSITGLDSSLVCKFCRSTEERYKRDAGVELYEALDALLRNGWQDDRNVLRAYRALALARNQKG